jgi:hypothetical protein
MGINMCKSVALLLVLLFSVVSSLFVAPSVFSSTQAAEDSWTFKTPMPTARIDFGVAVVNGKIYVIGGRNNSSYLNINEMYDPVTDTWTTKTPMPTPRAYLAVAAYRNKIYAIAGSTGTGSSTLANEVYDTITDTWETLSPLQSDTVRNHLSANVVNGKIYVISGVASDFPRGAPSSAENSVYDPLLDAWTTKAPIPQPVFQYASAVVDDKIYVIGGRNFQSTPSILGLTQIYDTTTDTWTNGHSMPTAAYWCLNGATTGLFAPKRIYIFGGYTTSGPDASWLGITRVYNPETNTWTTGTPAPADFARGRGTVVNDVFYAIGDDVNLQYTPIGYEPPDPSHDGTAPQIAILSPENKTYHTTDIQLTFTVNEPSSWIQYNLDYKTDTEIEGNSTLSGLSLGSHNVTVYAADVAGNLGVSETINFTVAGESESEPEPLPTALVVAPIISVAVIGVGLLIYFKKRKH